MHDFVIKVRENVKYCKGFQARRHHFLTSVALVELDSARDLGKMFQLGGTPHILC